jgi:hypothetical protein
MTRRFTRWLGAALTAATLCASPPSFAQAGDGPTPEALAAARSLFVEGIDLEKEGDWEAALSRFMKVADVKMTPQVRFHIALCHEKLGRWVDAVNGFEFAEQEARAAGDHGRDVLENAPKRAEALRARLAHIVINVEGKVYTSKVFIDGNEVALALAGSSIPVDPGDHVIAVKRAGKTTFSEERSFDEAESQEITLEIDDPKPEPKPLPKPAVVPGGGDPSNPVVPDDPPQWIAYVVAGVGVAALGGAGAMWGLRQQRLSGLECDNNDFTGCDPAFRAQADDAKNFDFASKVLLGVGAAGVVTGVALWFVLSPEDDPSPTSTGATKASIGIVPSPTGVHVLGRF